MVLKNWFLIDLNFALQGHKNRRATKALVSCYRLFPYYNNAGYKSLV